jgi:hypothetical protein
MSDSRRLLGSPARQISRFPKEINHPQPPITLRVGQFGNSDKQLSHRHTPIGRRHTPFHKNYLSDSSSV